MQIEFDRAEVTFEGRMALAPLTLTLSEPRVGVIGLNGSGKTTFARLINGLTKPTGGRVLVDGHDTVKDAKTVLGQVGFIFQNPANQIILPIIRDDIALGLANRGLGRQDIAAAVDEVLSRFDAADLAGRRAHELSGGELQLAALAAVLITAPKLVIFDEPSNQLDLKNRALVERTIARLPEQAIVISHDLGLIENFDRVLVFDAGRLAFDGAATQAIARYREIAAA
ncbi:MAG: energy-coupling factor ABC transporter ATP-binding protein [Allorhizobium sp.]